MSGDYKGSLSVRRVVQGHALHSIAQTRRIEAQAILAARPHNLMDRAGEAAGRLAMALCPHARSVWIACGPGNNGGDGLVAAAWLKHHGWNPVVTLHGLGDPGTGPADAQRALAQARAAGVQFADAAPAACDLAIDALLGIGLVRPPSGPIEEAIRAIQRCSGRGASGQHAAAGPEALSGRAFVLAVDVPSGLDADTGQPVSAESVIVHADATLTLLTVKPGLFTARGRDASGKVWHATLASDASLAASAPSAILGAPRARLPRVHASHKGSYGDVWVVGGTAGMTGAAVLAGRAALHAGAGRVFLHTLAEPQALHARLPPELMTRRLPLQARTQLNRQASVVCGCGGGTEVAAWILPVLEQFASAIFDADALNSIASDSQLRAAVRDHACDFTRQIVLTPHPLEAARLLGCAVATVQQDRLGAAKELAESTRCVVVLKGSGTVIAAPKHEQQVPVVNPTGNARLAVAGSGDVLAGLIGAHLARGERAFAAACSAVWEHGHIADCWEEAHLGTLTASGLAAALGA